jgi:hypothetical protein
MSYHQNSTSLKYIQIYYATGAAKDKKEDTTDAKSNDKTNIYSTSKLTLSTRKNKG